MMLYLLFLVAYMAASLSFGLIQDGAQPTLLSQEWWIRWATCVAIAATLCLFTHIITRRKDQP